MSLSSWSGAVRYGLPGLVLGVALSWGTGGGWGPEVAAQAAAPAERPRTAVPPATDPAGTIAFTASTGGPAQLLYLIDTRARAFAVYRIDPTNPKGAVKLEAARQYQWDLRLTEFSNAPPEVTAIESMVKSLGQPAR